MSFFGVKGLEWWYVPVVVGIKMLSPIFRAIAVVLVARTVHSDIAKRAIPLILTPVRPSLFSRRKMPDQEASNKTSSHQQ